MPATATAERRNHQRISQKSWPFSEFRTGSVEAGHGALEEFARLELAERKRYVDTTIAFLAEERDDAIRGWGPSLLKQVGGESAFQALLSIFANETSDEARTGYPYTRAFALYALDTISEGAPERRAQFLKLLDTLWVDPWQEAKEDPLVQAAAAVLLARAGRPEPLRQVVAMLRTNDDYRITWAALRALREVPLDDLIPYIVSVMRDSWYIDHRWAAIRALASYVGNENVVGELSLLIRREPVGYLRLEAVKALGRLGLREGDGALLHSLTDDNAEVRVQAAAGLASIMSPADACALVIGRALSADSNPEAVSRLVDGLRMIDRDRTVCAEILNKELGGENRRRAQTAEEILVNLGGWAAVHRLSQRRATLNTLDEILKDSEQAVKTNFEGTIRQARVNFYFAMSVNVLIVCVGIALIVLALIQLASDPDKFVSWVVPGAAGVFGVTITLTFNNPRQNAREDLASLLHVNVMFLGFLRQLNEIDATFKHAYIESHDFGTDDMKATVEAIAAAVDRALDNTSSHLLVAHKGTLSRNS